VVRVEDIVPRVVYYVFNPDHYIGTVIGSCTMSSTLTTILVQSLGRALCLQPWPLFWHSHWVVHYVFNPDHYIGIVIGSCTMSSTLTTILAQSLGRALCLQPWPLYWHSHWVVHYVFNRDHYIGIVIGNTTLVYKYWPQRHTWNHFFVLEWTRAHTRIHSL
jgi:hypothetical protein